MTFKSPQPKPLLTLTPAATTSSHLWPARPLLPVSAPVPKLATPVTQAGAARFGHSLAHISVFPPSTPVQRQKDDSHTQEHSVAEPLEEAHFRDEGDDELTSQRVISLPANNVIQRMKFKGMFGGLFGAKKEARFNKEEKELLAREREITAYFDQVQEKNPWITKVSSAKTVLANLQAISQATYEPREYANVILRLDELSDKMETILFADPTFANHHPDALGVEAGEFLGYSKKSRKAEDEFERGFVVTKYAQDPSAQLEAMIQKYHEQPFLQKQAKDYAASVRASSEKFDRMLATGSKVLWALDVDGNLSIGSPQNNKHAVVAGGRDVKGAGVAQLQISDLDDKYKAMEEFLKKASFHQKARIKLEEEQKHSFEPDPKLDKQIDDEMTYEEYYMEQAKELEDELSGYKPQEEKTKTVVLDFDSGHYAPRAAWRAATAAWEKAGYTVEWSTTSKFV